MDRHYIQHYTLLRLNSRSGDFSRRNESDQTKKQRLKSPVRLEFTRIQGNHPIGMKCYGQGRESLERRNREVQFRRNEISAKSDNY